MMRFSGFDEMLRYWAEKTPDKTALIFQREGLCTLSFAALYSQVLEKAEQLRAEGKTCIGILSDGSGDCVITIFAAVLAGLQVVMLDSGLSETVLGELIAYTDVDTLWGDEELKAELAPCLTGGVENGAGKMLYFTSGTTRRSKAVVLSDRSFCQSAWNGSAMLPLTPEDTLLCMLPLGHVFGFVCGLLWGLSCGAAVALGRGPRHYTDDLAYFDPTAVSLVPMLLGFVVKMGLINPRLKLILVGAGACPPALLAAAEAKGLKVSFGYGLTETSSGVAISVSGDPQAMEICPDNTITLAPDGEILIQAPTCVMEGYYKLPQDTAQALEGGLLHSGDIGRFDELGRLHITGRKKDFLAFSDGTKLFLPEYEAAIAGVLGAVDLAVVQFRDKAVLVLEKSWLDRDELMMKLLPAVRDYPRSQQLSDIVFTGEPLPKTATGKIKRWEIQERLEKRT